MEKREVQTNPPHQPHASAYHRIGIAVIDQSMGAQAAVARAQTTAEKTDHSDAVRPDVLADTIAHDLLMVYRKKFPNEAPSSVKAERGMTEDDRPEYHLSMRDHFGTGIDMLITPQSHVLVTPVQSLPTGREIRESSEEYRWKSEGHNTGYLEFSAGAAGRREFIPYVDPGIGNDDQFNAFGNAANAGLSAVSANSKGPPVATAALGVSHHEGELRVVRDGVLTSARNGYQQSGSIVYDGFTFVEKQNVGRGATVVYNKHDLERMAGLDRAALDRASSSDFSVRIGISGGQLSIEVSPQGLGVSRGYTPPTLQR